MLMSAIGAAVAAGSLIVVRTQIAKKLESTSPSRSASSQSGAHRSDASEAAKPLTHRYPKIAAMRDCVTDRARHKELQ